MFDLLLTDRRAGNTSAGDGQILLTIHYAAIFMDALAS
jgi:hypothetical protein